MLSHTNTTPSPHLSTFSPFMYSFICLYVLRISLSIISHAMCKPKTLLFPPLASQHTVAHVKWHHTFRHGAAWLMYFIRLVILRNWKEKNLQRRETDLMFPIPPHSHTPPAPPVTLHTRRTQRGELSWVVVSPTLNSITADSSTCTCRPALGPPLPPLPGAAPAPRLRALEGVVGSPLE